MSPSTWTAQPYCRPLVVQQALELLTCEVREGNALASPDAVRDYLRLLLAGRAHEVFVVVFLDAQNRVIETVELFRAERDFQREVLRRFRERMEERRDHRDGPPRRQ